MLLGAVLEWTDGRPASTYLQIVYPVLVGIAFFGTVNAFKSTVEIEEDVLWLRRPLPLQKDKSLRWSGVRRMRVKAAGDEAYLYTDLDGDPALTIGGQFERFSEMAAEIAGHLPEDAEIKDPAGKLKGD